MKIPVGKVDYFVIIAAALAIAVGVFFVIKNTYPQLSGDGLTYNTYAQSLATRGRFEVIDNILSDRRDPGFPLFLAVLYKLFKLSLPALRLLQVVVLGAIPAAVYAVARQLFARRPLARLAALLTAGFYPLAWYASILYSEAWLTLLLLLSSYYFLRATQENKLSFSAVSGLFFGLALLSRSLLIYFPILFFVIFLTFRIVPLKRAVVLLGLFVICSYLVVVPWMYRNYRQFGSFSVSEQSGPVLYFAIQRAKISNRDLPKVFIANLLGDFVAQQWFGAYDRFTLEEGDYGATHAELDRRNVSEQERDKILSGRARAFILQHPERYLLIVPPIEFLKLHTPIFPFETMQGLFSDPARYTTVPAALKFAVIFFIRGLYFLFFGFVVYGLVKSLPSWPRTLWIIALLVYLVAGYSLLHGIPRYAVPLFPFYIIFFSFGALHYLSRLSEGKFKSSV